MSDIVLLIDRLYCIDLFSYIAASLFNKLTYLLTYTATGTHMPHGITECCLPPGRGDIPALTPAEAGTRLSDPGGMQGWVDLVGWLHTEMVYPPEDSHPSRY